MSDSNRYSSELNKAMKILEDLMHEVVDDAKKINPGAASQISTLAKKGDLKGLNALQNQILKEENDRIKKEREELRKTREEMKSQMEELEKLKSKLKSKDADKSKGNKS